MITFLLVEDECKVYELLQKTLREEGYDVVDESESKGTVKIIRKCSPGHISAVQQIIENKGLLLSKEGTVYRSLVDDIETDLIQTVLKKTEGNQIKASKILGINRNTLRMKIVKLGIDVKKWKV